MLVPNLKYMRLGAISLYLLLSKVPSVTNPALRDGFELWEE